MGISWSNRRRNNYYLHYPPPPPLPPPPPPHLVPSSATQFYSSEPSTENHLSYPSNPCVISPPPPTYIPHNPYHPTYSNYYYHSSSYANPVVGRSNYCPYGPYYANQASGWSVIQQPMAGAQAPPPYVEHQNAKKIRNDVNLHKHTLKVEVDEENPDQHLVSFVFDAMFDGSITIYYFAKEEANCRFVPVFPEAYTSVKVPFQKGLGQRFCQPSGTGIDLGFFELDDLSKPSPGEDVFPLLISAETCVPSDVRHDLGEYLLSASPHMQITQAVLEKNNEEPFKVRVVRQILWVDGVRYELREIYGMGSSAREDVNDDSTGKECVICMTEQKDTTVLPCRHMCMCGECAKELRLQSNKCPICRQPIEELLEIRINNNHHQ